MQTASVHLAQRLLREAGPEGWLELQRTYGTTFRLQGAVISSDPAVVRAVLTDRRHIDRRASPYKLMDRIIPGSPGILFKEGEEWVTRLRVLMPTFTPGRIDSLAGEILQVATDFSRRWTVGARYDDLMLETSRLGARIVLQAGYNLQPDHPVAARFAEELVGYKFTTMTLDNRRRLDELGFRLRKLRHLPWAIAMQLDLRRRVASLGNRVEELCRDLPLFDPARRGWIQVLAEAGFAPADLTNELNHLYGAYNAVDFVITCALVELDRNPAWGGRVREELSRRAEQNGEIGWADLERLPDTRAFILEVLRRYPVAMSIFREVGHPLPVDGETLKPGTVVMVPLFSLHHDPQIWRDPLRFDPGRWLESSESRDRFAFVPFLDGPRKCIGQRLAELQILLVLFALRNRRIVIDSERARINRYIVPRWDRELPFRVAAVED